MFDTYVKALGSTLLVPMAIIIAGLYLTKGIYGLRRSRNQDRKDFLDLWAKSDKADGFWLQVAVRHLYGENLPMPLIRHLLGLPQAARGLVEVSFAWRLLDIDDATGELYWRNPRHYRPWVRVWEARLYLIGYLTMGLASLGSVWLGFFVEAKSVVGVISWVYALLFGAIAYAALIKCERLRDAHIGVPRWTTKFRWKEGRWDKPTLKSARRAIRKRREWRVR